MAVLERIAERLLRSSFVDLGTVTLESSSYLLYFFYKYERKRRFVVTFKTVIGLCYFSPLP